MDKRILTHLVLLTLIISCSKGKPHQTPHPDQGAVVVTADWSGKSSEADIPQKYVLRIADVKQEVSGEKNTFKQLLDPGQYSLAVYNTPEHIAVDGNVASMEKSSAGDIAPSPGYLFASVQEITVLADDSLRVTAPMKQLVRRLDLELTATEGDYGRVQSATATLSGVASAVDIETGERSGAATVTETFIQDGQTFSLSFRLLGIVPNESQTLVVNITYAGGETQRIDSGLSDAMKRFNDEAKPMKLTGSLHLPIELGSSAAIGAWSGGKSETVFSDKVKCYKADDLKIGDYFYSDGTWSDGGLRKIYSDGRREIADPKPGPDRSGGKVVIGIVFQTDPYRIGLAEKEALGGEAHGLVMALRNTSVTSSVQWAANFNYLDEGLTKILTQKQLYEDISGYANNKHILSNRGSFDNYPAFKASKEYPAPAPATTTGWFLPSSGQWWDILQNLGSSHDLAQSDQQNSSATEDPDAAGFVWNGNVAAALNGWLSEVAAEGKSTFDESMMWFWSSSEYSNGYALAWNVTIYGWLKCSHNSKGFWGYVRPILAF